MMGNEIKANLERKVHYYETDAMGIVHNTNYFRWFEEARVLWMDESGISYGEVEKNGIRMPITGTSCEYKTPAKFGDTICVKAYAKEITRVKYVIGYSVTNKETGELLATGETRHCFVNFDFKPINIQKYNPEICDRLSKLC